MPRHGTYSLASRKELDDLIAAYNKSCPEDSLTLKQTEDAELCIEGYARIHWGVTVPIQFRKDDGTSSVSTKALRLQRTARLSYAVAMENSLIEDTDQEVSDGGAAMSSSSSRPSLDAISEGGSGSRQPGPSQLNRAWSLNGRVEPSPSTQDDAAAGPPSVTMRRPAKRGGRGAARLQRINRRCSINGHFYRPETATDFTPSFGMLTRVRVSSRSTSADVVSMLLAKFKIENPPTDFGLYVVKENGDMRILRHDEPPLLLGTMLRESPDVRIFLMDARTAFVPHDKPQAAAESAAVATPPPSSLSPPPSGIQRPESAVSAVAFPVGVSAGSNGTPVTKKGTSGHHLQATSDFESLPEPMLHAFLAKFLKDENDDIVRIQYRYWYLRKQLEALLPEAATRSDSGLVETYL